MEQIKSDNQFKINWQGLRALIRNSELSRGAKVIFVDLLLYAGIDGNSFPSQEILATNQNLSSKQVQNLLKELKQKRFIEWKRGGFGKSNRYSFNPEIYFATDDSDTKYISADSGNTLPVQSGNIFPPNVVNKSNKLSSSHLLQLFEKTNKENVSEQEKRKFLDLCQRSLYPPEWIEDAINIARKRNKPFINTAYLVKILEEWRIDGKPSPKPIFKPCGLKGCDNGNIPKKNIEGHIESYIICKCREEYQEELKRWEKKWGGFDYA